MNRPILSACLILSAALGAVAIVPAQAGGAIMKCVDGAGRVTLTDQPCEAGTVASTVAMAGPPADTRPATPAATARTQAFPMRAARWTPAATAHAPLSSDVATLKQARMQMLLQDSAPRMRLAVLDR